jgi:hypothetical protein
MKKKEKIKKTPAKTPSGTSPQNPPLHHSKGTLAFAPARTKTLSIIINRVLLSFSPLYSL